MATNTPNLNLVKPDLTDFADIRVINRNMDILDEAITIVDSWRDGPNYWVKYSDGKLEQGGLIEENWEISENSMLHITFRTPFIDNNYIIISTLAGDRNNSDDLIPPVVNSGIDKPSYASKAGKTATGCYISREQYSLGLYYICIGSWK